jgi:hypothetical protein
VSTGGQHGQSRGPVKRKLALMEHSCIPHSRCCYLARRSHNRAAGRRSQIPKQFSGSCISWITQLRTRKAMICARRPKRGRSGRSEGLAAQPAGLERSARRAAPCRPNEPTSLSRSRGAAKSGAASEGLAVMAQREWCAKSAVNAAENRRPALRAGRQSRRKRYTARADSPKKPVPPIVEPSSLPRDAPSCSSEFPRYWLANE